jgi:dipeptidyl-peptidase-4
MTKSPSPRRSAWAQGFAAVALLGCALPAQGTRADYARCEGLRTSVEGKVSRSRVEPRWIDGGPRFWYRADAGGARFEFVLVDPVAGTREALEKAPDGAEPENGGERTGRRRANEGGRRPGARRTNDSPDGRWSAFVRDHQLWLRDRTSADERRLSVDGSAEDSYSAELAWSPDGKRCVAMRTPQVVERRVPLIESSPKDQVQPKLHEFDYAKPGDPLPVGKPTLFDVETGRPIPIDQALFATPWSITELRWEKDSTRFTFLYNERGHHVLRLLAVDAVSGAVSTLVDEVAATFVDYAHKTWLHWLDDTNEFVWMSERDGWNHLYLCDARTGAVKRQITKGNWVVRAVDHADDAARSLVIRTMGMHANQDPYHVHFARVSLDGGEPLSLTDGDGTHEIVFSPDRAYYLDTWSRVDLPPVVELRRSSDASLVMTLERADWSALLATGWQVPERIVAKGRDGTTDIWGVLWKPSTFHPSRRYPVIESIYAGPHGAHAPKSFAPWREPQSLAELGFIVVKLDGMGTNWRGKVFHDVAWKNLADSGFPDRIAWIRAAATERPWMDLDHVGIYGGSAGGQSAVRALIAHGDFYSAAAADCGCHDNRMDKVWWNELWMGWPIGPHYAEQSNVTNAAKLQGKLLLTVGELDRNVDPASTFQLVNALIAADKDFEFIVFPGAGHGAGESAYGQRRRRDFFVRSLWGVEPRRD